MKRELTEEQVEKASEVWNRVYRKPYNVTTHEVIRAIAPYIQYPVEIPEGLAEKIGACISYITEAFAEAQKPKPRFTVRRWSEISSWWDVYKDSGLVATFNGFSYAQEFCDRRNKEAESE